MERRLERFFDGKMMEDLSRELLQSSCYNTQFIICAYGTGEKPRTVCATVEDDRHWVDIAAQEAEQVCGCRPDLFSTVPGEAFMCTENLSDAIAPWRSSTFKRRKFNVFIPFSGKTDTLWAYYLYVLGYRASHKKTRGVFRPHLLESCSVSFRSLARVFKINGNEHEHSESVKIY